MIPHKQAMLTAYEKSLVIAARSEVQDTYIEKMFKEYTCELCGKTFRVLRDKPRPPAKYCPGECRETAYKLQVIAYNKKKTARKKWVFTPLVLAPPKYRVSKRYGFEVELSVLGLEFLGHDMVSKPKKKKTGKEQGHYTNITAIDWDFTL